MRTRFSKIKATGCLLESQSGGDENNPLHLQTLIDNAVSAGFDKDDIEVGWEEHKIIEGWLSEQAEAEKTYSDRRKESYPPATDYLDGVVKGDQGQIDKYIADCLAVKDKYPKP